MQKKPTSDIIQHTVAFWEERTGLGFSREEARQMVDNVTGFFQILAEWDRKAKIGTNSDASTSYVGDKTISLRL